MRYRVCACSGYVCYVLENGYWGMVAREVAGVVVVVRDVWGHQNQHNNANDISGRITILVCLL